MGATEMPAVCASPLPLLTLGSHALGSGALCWRCELTCSQSISLAAGMSQLPLRILCLRRHQSLAQSSLSSAHLWYFEDFPPFLENLSVSLAALEFTLFLLSPLGTLRRIFQGVKSLRKGKEICCLQAG